MSDFCKNTKKATCERHSRDCRAVEERQFKSRSNHKAPTVSTKVACRYGILYCICSLKVSPMLRVDLVVVVLQTQKLSITDFNTGTESVFVMLRVEPDRTAKSMQMFLLTSVS